MIVWVDCFGQSSGTDWGCSCPVVHHWAGCLWHHSPDLQSSPASPGWEEAWSLGSPSSEWWLVRLLQENMKQWTFVGTMNKYWLVYRSFTLTKCVKICFYFVCHKPLALMLLRSVIFISILGNMWGLWGLLLLTYIFSASRRGSCRTSTFSACSKSWRSVDETQLKKLNAKTFNHGCYTGGGGSQHWRSEIMGRSAIPPHSKQMALSSPVSASSISRGRSWFAKAKTRSVRGPKPALCIWVRFSVSPSEKVMVSCSGV